MPDIKPLAAFTAAVIEALYFTETGDTGQPPGDAELDPDCLARLASDCREFWNAAGDYILDETRVPDRVQQAGHDFWFTRNGHGVGFWDGDWPQHGEQLTRIAQGFREFDDVVWLNWEPGEEE